jgi:hypothetical protein
MIRDFGMLTLFGVMLVGTDALAEESVKETTTTTTTTSTSGTISEFGPGTIVVKSTTSSAPVRYTYTKTTTYVDEMGKPVSIETVKTGVPVTVYPDSSGKVATKVVVTKTEKETEIDD